MDMIMDTTKFVIVVDNELRTFESFEEAACFFEEINEAKEVVAYMINGTMGQLILARR